MAKSWKTRLIHSDITIPKGYRSLASPVFRGSTTLFSDAASVEDSWDQHAVGYTYGLYGTPTTLELAAKVCELEKGYRTIITPGGQGAISLINLSFLRSGDHILLPENVYTPNRKLTRDVLQRFGVETSFYAPEVGGSIKDLLRENTKLIWCESPGSITVEVADVPAIVEAAHGSGVLVALDNTWSAGVFLDAFTLGVDVTMQALTKYIGGHSDLLLGSVTVKDPKLYQQLGATHQLLGCAASPDDCNLALRGMKTMAVRLSQIEASALRVARWLRGRPEIDRVLHPAIETSPGHEFWKRDFTGSTGVFSVVFSKDASKIQVQQFVNNLELFKIGYSWGGVTSLAVAYDFQGSKGRPDYGHRIVRLNIGLEECEDLILDLQASMQRAFGG